MTKGRRRTLEDVWATIPDVACKGLCQDSCGPIAMSVEEDLRLRARGVNVPPIGEALRKLAAGDDYRCPALDGGRCTVYDIRPTICRLWGATTEMSCPHGCTPANALSAQEGYAVLGRANKVGGGRAEHFFGD